MQTKCIHKGTACKNVDRCGPGMRTQMWTQEPLMGIQKLLLFFYWCGAHSAIMMDRPIFIPSSDLTSISSFLELLHGGEETQELILQTLQTTADKWCGQMTVRNKYGVSKFFTNFCRFRRNHEIFVNISSQVSKLVELFTEVYNHDDVFICIKLWQPLHAVTPYSADGGMTFWCKIFFISYNLCRHSHESQPMKKRAITPHIDNITIIYTSQ